MGSCRWAIYRQKSGRGQAALFPALVIVLSLLGPLVASGAPSGSVNGRGALDVVGMTKYSGNPVLATGTAAEWDSMVISSKAVVLADGVYMMWYSGGNEEIRPRHLGLATSTDGLSWTKDPGNPVFSAGATGSWDEGGMAIPVIIKDGSLFKMWYTGFDGFNGITATNAKIGYATSSDGRSWTRYSGNPVLDADPSAQWESSNVYPCTVLKEDGVYKMWYNGYDGLHAEVGYATSPDGVSWTRYVGNPVLRIGPAGGWDSVSAAHFSVVNVSGTYHAWYSGNDGVHHRIGYASSPDGITWTKYSRNPVFVPEGTGWESNDNLDPAVLYNGTGYQMWYTGVDNNYLPMVYSIGYAGSVAPPAPVPTSPAEDAWIASARPVFGWNFTDNNGRNAVSGCRVQLSGDAAFGTILFDSGQAVAPGGTYSPASDLPDGVHHWRLRVWDQDGLRSGWSAGRKVMIDASAPANPDDLSSPSHVAGAWSANTVIDIRWSVPTAGDTASGYAGFSVVWDYSCATVPDETVDTAGNLSRSPAMAGEGAVYFHIRARDIAGNWNATAATAGPFLVDAGFPANPSRLEGNGASPHNWHNLSVISVGWEPPADSQSGLAGYSISWDAEAGSLPPEKITLSAEATCATSPALADGDSWYFHIRSADRAGNWNPGAEHLGPFWVDTSPPENPPSLYCDSHSPGVPANLSVVKIGWPEGLDGLSGVGGYSWAWDASPDTLPPASPSAGGDIRSASSPPLADGSWYFHLRTFDRAGNWAPGAVHAGPFIVNTTTGPPPDHPPAIRNVHWKNVTEVDFNEELTFTVEAQSPDGSPLNYTWTDNGTAIGTGRVFSHVFPPGGHVLVLVVDNGRLSATRTFEFTVAPKPPEKGPGGPEPGPTIDAGTVAGGTVLVAAGALTLVAAATEAWRYRLWLLFFALYTRIGREEVLDNETRGMIRGVITADPGIHYSDLLRRVQAGNGTVAHHLMILEREGMIKSRRDGALRRFYPGEMKLGEVHVRLSGVQKVILEQVRRREGQSQRQVAAAAELPYLTVHRQVGKMVALGVLRLEHNGISSRVFVADGWREGATGAQKTLTAVTQTMIFRE